MSATIPNDTRKATIIRALELGETACLNMNLLESLEFNRKIWIEAADAIKAVRNQLLSEP